MAVYRNILRVPGVAAIVIATVIGRLPIGVTGLAILLFVQDVQGSFAAAGICAGALALGSAAGAPFQGRLVDHRGEGVLLPMALAHAGGLVLVWVLGAADAGVPVLASSAPSPGPPCPRCRRSCARAGPICCVTNPGSCPAPTRWTRC